MNYLSKPLAVISLSAVLAGACSSTASSEAVEVIATDSKCTPAKTSIEAGQTQFKVTNKGSKVTELYVYGDGDKVISEVENVGPGTSRTLTVDLKAGHYELACKPGQVGKGIRQAITVSGKGGSSGATKETYDREIELDANEYAFTFKTSPDTIKVGEAIEFKMHNKGAQEHELEIFAPDSSVLGEIGHTGAGGEGEVVLKFAKAGAYRYICDIDDHASRGMKGTFTVS